MAWATPSSRLEGAICQPLARARVFRSSGALSMRTARPAACSMETLFQLSPMASISAGSMSRSSASVSSAAPLEQLAGRMSRILRSRAAYSVRWRVSSCCSSDVLLPTHRDETAMDGAPEHSDSWPETTTPGCSSRRASARAMRWSVPQSMAWMGGSEGSARARSMGSTWRR